MNKELAEMYGNDGNEDLQKLAAAELAEKLADDGSVDFSALSIEDMEEIAKELVAETKVEETPTEPEKDPPEKVAEKKPDEKENEELTEDQQKLAEADYLGRVMAHSFTQERREIEKEASEKTAGFKDQAGKVGAHLKGLAGKAKDGVAKHKGKAGLAAGAAAGFGAGRMSKKGSGTPALDALVEARRAEILEANGIKPEETPAKEEKPTKEPEQEKTAADDEKKAALANYVEEQAIARLKEEGYEFEEPKTEEPAKKE